MMGISNDKDIAYGLKSWGLSLVLDRTEVKLAFCLVQTVVASSE